MRITQHNGRKGKNGVYSSKHNDRNFDVDNAQHIDKTRSNQNCYFCCYDNMSFEEAERKFYQEHFGSALDQQNEKHKKARQVSRIKSIDDYRTSEKTCPEEQILQVGKVGSTISADLLQDIITEQLRWEEERFPQVVLLDVALHLDETTPHAHVRKVWVGHDKNGNEVVSQAKALKEMGVENGAGTRYDNAKIRYTEECRKHFEEVCKTHGIVLDRGRLQGSKQELDLITYKQRQEEARLTEMRKDVFRYAHSQEYQNANNIKGLTRKVNVLERFLEQNGINPSDLYKTHSNTRNQGHTK